MSKARVSKEEKAILAMLKRNDDLVLIVEDWDFTDENWVEYRLYQAAVETFNGWPAARSKECRTRDEAINSLYAMLRDMAMALLKYEYTFER